MCLILWKHITYIYIQHILQIIISFFSDAKQIVPPTCIVMFLVAVGLIRFDHPSLEIFHPYFFKKFRVEWRLMWLYFTATCRIQHTLWPLCNHIRIRFLLSLSSGEIFQSRIKDSSWEVSESIPTNCRN